MTKTKHTEVTHKWIINALYLGPFNSVSELKVYKAAPELLEALKVLENRLSVLIEEGRIVSDNQMPIIEGELGTAREAISKAQGGS